MTKRRNIVPFGGQDESETFTETTQETAPAEEYSEQADDWYEVEPETRRNLGWITPVLGLLGLAAWTAFFVWARQGEILARPTPSEWTGLLAQWSMPAVLVVALWMLAMRNSRVEASRFADVASSLRTESRALEDRLSHVNSELSIAREFIIAQGRDLEALGRIASERLGESAGKLESLISDNSERVDRLQTVSSAALDNMEKLRGQLPVVTNATRDLTNNIGQAGQGASAQLERLSEGFARIGEAGEASSLKVDVMRERVNEVLGDFTSAADHLGQIAQDRFAALDAESAALRERMDQQEIAALAAVRSRADELEGLLETTRARLSETESFALSSLREQLATLDNAASDLSTRMRDDETMAVSGWRDRIAGIENDARALFAQIDNGSGEALDAAGTRIAALSAEISRLHSDLRRQGETLDAEIEARVAKSEDAGRGLTERLGALVAGLDSEIEARRVRGAQASRALVEELATTFASLDSDIHDRAQRSEESGRMLAERLTAILAGLDSDISRRAQHGEDTAREMVAKVAEALAEFDRQVEERSQRGEQQGHALAARISSALASLDNELAARAQRGEETGRTVTGAIAGALTSLDEEIETRAERGRETASLMSDSLRTALDALDSEIERRRNHSRQAGRELAEGYADELAELDRQLDERRNRHEKAGHEVTERLTALLAQFDTDFEERRRRQLESSESLGRHAEQIAARLGEYGDRMDHVSSQSRAAEEAIVNGLGNLSQKLEASREALSGTDGAIMALTDSSVRLLELIEASSRHTREALPGALSEAEGRLDTVESRIEAMRNLLGQAGERGDQLGRAVDTTRETTKAALAELEGLHDTLQERGSAHSQQLADLRETLSQARNDSEMMASAAEATLNGAIARLADASREAVANIEGTSSDAVRSIAEKLAKESGIVVTQALRESTHDALEGLDATVSKATEAARRAAAELHEQLGRVDEITGHLEARIVAARQRAEEDIDEHFAKRVSQITESLNSTAIDIDKVLSAEVSENAWQAYLKGERGIFTRRAVRLLDSGEARHIVDHYETESEFREHVNRYIHDFEAMLRNLLATREGNTLAVTMLSSDMGKLYVALAQAIERLRR
ncbi:hypothetical protein [Croceicoccus bisphenolivorans]|uniref:hypothetical protein n=1 Tax=Croceicoccus bisphenolivorans TaxID=1783232 RepID=UPI00082ADFBB|nr:hypothetical protein [Croceicoccus bisphenolivorans]